MSKPLSQEEIDILLEVRTQLSEADDYDLAQLESMVAADSDRRINPYNFKRPRLYAQDQMRVLNHVHEAFARDLSVYLSAQLRTIVDINLTAVDQVLYSEYVMSSAPPSAIYVVEVEELNQKIILELDPRLVIFTIEKLFGGPGVFLRKPREVSQIERRIMSKVMQRAFRELEKAWHQVFDMQLKEIAFESNAEFVQIIPGVEPALVSTFEVVIYEQRSFINICYPYRLLERVLGRTGMKQWISSATTPVPPAVRERYEGTVRGVDVQLRAELGRAKIPVSELKNLEVGDVIPLMQKVTDPIRLFVGSHEKFKAAPGRAGRHRALRITHLIEGQTEHEDDEHR
jgi:flagellar motor switch protein FliM